MLKKYIKEINVSRDDVALMMKNVIFNNTLPELMGILSDETQPMVIRLFVKAFVRDYKDGSLYNIQTMFDRIFGPPKQEINISGNITVTAMTYEQRQELIDGYIKKYQSDMQGGDDLADRPDHGISGEFEEVEQEGAPEAEDQDP